LRRGQKEGGPACPFKSMTALNLGVRLCASERAGNKERKEDNIRDSGGRVREKLLRGLILYYLPSSPVSSFRLLK